jgi:hypothetical protein
MLDIFDEFNLSKYIHSPYVPPIDPLHPTLEEEIDMLRNLRTINLIIRGLPKVVLSCMQNFECAYTLWNDLEKRYPDYSLKNLDEILHKTIAFHKMKPSDPNFDDCLFELRDLMRAKGEVRTISNIITEAIRIHKVEQCHDHESNEFIALGDDHIHVENDDVKHGYYDEDEELDIEFEKTMRNLSLMANLQDYMAGGKEWILDSGCTDHMTGDRDMFHELAKNDGPCKYVTFRDNSKGKVLGLGKVAISNDSSIENVMLVESLGYNLLSVSRLANFGFNVERIPYLTLS